MKLACETVLVFHSCVRSSWQEMLGGIRSFAQSRRWRLQVVEHVPPRKAIGELLDFWRPDGVIVEAGMDEDGTFAGDVFGRLPVVYLLSDVHRLKATSLHVDCDVDALGALAAREFLTLGAKSFVFFGFRDIFWSESRGAAFEKALALNGCHAEVLSQRFVESGRGGGSADTRSLDRLIRCLRDLPKPCGVFAANDMLADEILGLCQACGLKVPADVAVLGVDDDESVCEHTNPTLSSLRPDFFGAGFASAEMLEERLRKKGRMPSVCRRTISSVQLVRRGSTRLLPRSNADVSKALELIRRQACDGLRPRDVFARMAVSSRLVEMRFRELTGHTVAEEIRLVRLERAKKLLREGALPIGEIATRCGWKSAAQLRAYFAEAEGVSPRTWRQRSCRI